MTDTHNTPLPEADADNKQTTLAEELLNTTGANLFLTGKAGTGKTTFLRRLCKESKKRIVVLAPTGIAAINAGGMTIHSFFQLSFGPFIPEQSNAHKSKFRFSKHKLKVIRTMDLLVIDEISMVRADLLDAVDDALRRLRNPRKPFGGVQLLMIGDLAQLPPVVVDSEWGLLANRYDSPYFFSSNALKSIDYEIIELQKVYRQEAGEFLNLLNRIRENTVDAETLAALNSRYIPNFTPSDGEHWIRLVTHNAQANTLNERELAKIPAETFVYTAKVSGEFPESSYPAEASLSLKVGAQVMFIKNDTETHLFYNGLLGRVVALDDTKVTVSPADGKADIVITPMEWVNNKYTVDDTSGEIHEEQIGSFTQMPLKKAWAITIHKSQGLTFSRAIIDASASFAHGQTYVALSRCRTIEGLVLDRPLQRDSLICDYVVTQFMKQSETKFPTDRRMSELRQHYYLAILDELFNFSPLLLALEGISRLMDENLMTTFPILAENWRQEFASFRHNIFDVATRFANQYRTLLIRPDSSPSDSAIDERIRKGAQYFYENLLNIHTLLAKTPATVDNKAVAKRLERFRTDIRDELIVKDRMLEYVAQNGINTAEYLNARAKAIIALENTPAASKPRTSKGKKATRILTVPPQTEAQSAQNVSESPQPNIDSSIADQEISDIKDANLYNKLKSWRFKEAKKINRPAFVVFYDKTLIALANIQPTTIEELCLIKGIGQAKANKYGEALIEIIKNHQG
ncbi:MAG: AAA family ATPase [Muribaculaceae bacterium]|nr:AAA family ATPase [Muribaculaceae bacterium]